MANDVLSLLADRNDSKLDRIMEREFATSKSKIYMYLRLNYLTDELLEALDNKKIKLKAAVELSYVNEEIQNIIYDYVIVRQIYKLNVRKAVKIKNSVLKVMYQQKVFIRFCLMKIK